MDEKSFDTGTGTVAYWVDASAGSDKPWLVFLPGLTADHALFDAQMAHFSGKANCLVWDAPAHGAGPMGALAQRSRLLAENVPRARFLNARNVGDGDPIYREFEPLS